ncbi:MAG: cyclase family protein [Oscillospiraceae bacterium]|nr:cyclase family protein [Oscillospiraceae bacterium]
MKVIDITREILSAPLYPGDPAPRLTPISTLAQGDAFQLSLLETTLHCGTHCDLPLHVLPDGEDAAQVSLQSFCGECLILRMNGLITGADIEDLPLRGCKRLLICGEGKAHLDKSAAWVLADRGVVLVGTDDQTIAREPISREVHTALLGSGIAILEGLELSDVPSGKYFLVALPLKLSGGDGSPVRAVLLESETGY